MRVRSAICLLVVALSATASAAARRLNLYEWLAVAPVVLEAEHLDTHGKYAEFRVIGFLRSEGETHDPIRVKVRRSNRDRNRQLDKEALRFDSGLPYLLLLSPAATRQADAPPTFDLVRGTHGAREVPLEGRAPFIDAVRRFIAIQDRNDDGLTWLEMRAMVEEVNPWMVDTALDQLLKFQRGDPDLLGSLRPLLDHPSASTRERTAYLMGEILRRHGDQTIPDAALLRNEIVGRARRDREVVVRVAATRALGEIEGAAVATILAEIAEGDPDQEVRYEAERILFERRQAEDDLVDRVPPPHESDSARQGASD